jgi:hypothetical protein
VKIIQFYYDKNRLEEAIYWLSKFGEECFDDCFLTIAFGLKDLRLLEGISDILGGLTDSDLEILASYIKKDIEKIEELYLT